MCVHILDNMWHHQLKNICTYFATVVGIQWYLIVMIVVHISSFLIVSWLFEFFSISLLLALTSLGALGVYSFTKYLHNF